MDDIRVLSKMSGLAKWIFRTLNPIRFILARRIGDCDEQETIKDVIVEQVVDHTGHQVYRSEEGVMGGIEPGGMKAWGQAENNCILAPGQWY